MRALPIILAMFAAQSVAAEPCVSATFDTPLEGAQNVVTRTADVPSPQFPGLWQEGNLGGYFYALYSNGEGVLKASKRVSPWQVEIACTDPSASCDLKTDGTPPTDAGAFAEILAQCLKGQQQEAPPPAPEAPCGLATVPEGPPVRVLQSLLVSAGENPGPVDGFMGARTRNALVAVLGDGARSLAVPEALAALDAQMCGAQD